ncbi:MAG: MBL fold metallo-hydrolase [Pseudomonadota bacterium]
MLKGTDFAVTFWGVRGSVPCPGLSTLRYGGNTSCVEVRCGEHRLILDAGTGLRELGQVIGGSDGTLRAHIFFSHTHLDHIGGLPFFRPAYREGNCFEFWGGHLKSRGASLRQVLETLLQPPLFPVPLNILHSCVAFHDFDAGQTLEPFEGVTVRTIPLDHPGGATGYRIEFGGRSLCFITDVEHAVGETSCDLVSFVRDSDLMIYDTTYTDEEFLEFKGWGHSTWQQGIRICEQADVTQLACFHHDPRRTDSELDKIAEVVANARRGSVVAREGLTLFL